MNNKKTPLQAAAEILIDAANAEQKENIEFITIEEAGELIKLSRWSIMRRLRLKDEDGNYIIRWHKLGKSRNAPVRIAKASFIAFLESQVQYTEDASVTSTGKEANHVQPNR